MSDKGENIWQEVKVDLREKTQSGYKMALLDSDKLLRQVLKERGYPGKDLKKQLFWAGINLSGREDLKKAIKKKDEILNESDYRLSSFEIEDFLAAYKKAVEWVLSAKKLGFKRKIGLYLENYLFLKNTSLTKVIVVILILFFGIKFFSSTETGKNIVEKTVEVDNLFFDWLKVLILIGLGISVVVFISFIYLDKKKKVKIKE
ncbi:MAG: hypothetical protein AAB632_02355 [Patescibacteria group bacterium]